MSEVSNSVIPQNKWRVFNQTIEEVRSTFADLSSEASAQIIAEAVADARLSHGEKP